MLEPRSPIKHGHFPIKHGRFPIKHGHCPTKHGAFNPQALAKLFADAGIVLEESEPDSTEFMNQLDPNGPTGPQLDVPARPTLFQARAVRTCCIRLDY